MRRLYIFIGLISFSLFLSSSAFADITYTIEKGDSLYKISKKFCVTIKEIKAKNNMTSSRLRAGKKLVIPVKEEPLHEEKDINKKEEPTNQDTNSKVSVSSKFETPYHIVKKGDNLWSLSKKYSIPVHEIKEINNLSSTKLKLGQKLLLKKTAVNHVSNSDALNPTLSKNKDSLHSSQTQEVLLSEEVKTYTVKKGDSLYRIAKKFNIGVDDLKDMNLLETDRLKPGQELLLESEEEEEDEVVSEVTSEETDELTESEEPGMKERVVLFAKKLLNIPYRFGGNGIFGIDCSGYVKKVYSMIGINLPRSAREQFHKGLPVDREKLSIGDLVFFRTYAPFPSHVGIYLGDNLFIHASSEVKKVTIDSLNRPYYLKRFIGAKRVIGEDFAELH